MFIKGITQQFLLVSLFFIPLTVHATTVVKNATYDDITTLGNNPLGTYDSLIYTNVNVTRARADVLAGPGVLTASYPNCAITAAHTSGVITQPPTSGTVASVTVAPPYKSLELLDFYYGCTLHQAAGPAANGAPVDCTVTVTAVQQISFAPVVAATFEFRPPEGLLLPVNMNHAVLPARFQQPLVNVTLTQDNAMAVVLMDNFHYSVST